MHAFAKHLDLIPERPNRTEPFLTLLDAFLGFFFYSQSAQALSYDDLQGLTYLQVKGSGIANTCPVIEGGSTNLKDLKAGTYK